MKIADKILNNFNEGQLEAEEFAADSFKQSLDKELKGSLTPKEIRNLYSLMATAMSSLGAKKFESAVSKAVKAFEKGADIE